MTSGETHHTTGAPSGSIPRKSRGLKRLLLAFLLAGASAGAAAPVAGAAPFTVGIPEAGPVSAPEGTTDASAYSTFRMSFTFDTNAPKVRRLSINLPRGASGTISNAEFCPHEVFLSQNLDACPEVSRIGKIDVDVVAALRVFGAIPMDYDTTASGHIVSLAPQGTEAARLGMVYKADASTEVKHSETAMRLNDDYSTRAEPQSDLARHTCGISISGLPLVSPCADITVKKLTLTMFGRVPGTGGKGFFFNPARCDRPLQTGVTAWAYDGADPDDPYGGSQASDAIPLAAVTGCDRVRFEPTFEMGPSSAAAAAAHEVSIGVRQPVDATGATIAPPFDSVNLYLPEGLALTPSTNADGKLEACTDQQFDVAHLGTRVNCPEGSLVGGLQVESPMVHHLLPGKVYLALPEAGDTEAIARLFMVGEYGPQPDDLRAKFEARVISDPQTGRLSATLANLPPQPVREITITFRGGDAPVMRQPRSCGVTNGVGHFRSTARPDEVTESVAAYTVDRNCELADRFAPTAAIHTASTQAGASTALSTVFAVPGGHQELSSLRFTMPPGLLGKLTASAQCPVALAQAGGCGDDSLIGAAQADAGIATAPLAVHGTVHLTEGFDGAIAGMMVSLPAKVGPIDLGWVRTLARIDLVGNDLRMQVSAQVPTHLQGIPLDLRRLAIAIGRPGLIVNPTSCAPAAADAAMSALQGGAAVAQAPYAATGCEALDWQPGARLDFTGKSSELAKGGRPTMTTVITQNEGQGNMSALQLLMPEAISTDLKNINARVCESAATAFAGGCPAPAMVGAAEVHTSALHGSITGQVLLVRVPGATLPGIAVRIRDQIAVDLLGKTAIDRSGRIRANFDGMPDAPISSMKVTFEGGPTGILQLNGPLCDGSSKQVADSLLTSHSGLARTGSTPVSCNGKPVNTQSSVRGSATSRLRNGGGSVIVRNPSGIRRVELRLPKGASFDKRLARRASVKAFGRVPAQVKLKRTQRRLLITVTPRTKGAVVKSLRVTLRSRTIRVDQAFRRQLARKKLSKKTRDVRVKRVMTPAITVTDPSGRKTKLRATASKKRDKAKQKASSTKKPARAKQ